jgi:competence protein ComEC
MRRRNAWFLFILFVLLLVGLTLFIRQVLFPALGDRLPGRRPPADSLPAPIDTVPPLESVFQVHFIDVGQGDAILVRTPRTWTLVDGGERPAPLLDYLARLAVDTIHLMVSTHPHADHIGGLPAVLRSHPVLEVIDPGVVHTTRLFTRYLELIDSLEILFTVGRAGMERDLGGGARLQVLHPVEPSDRHLNDASVVTRLELGAVSVLLAGDMERRSETELIERQIPVRSDILKVAHHGSTTSSSAAFLDAVQPDAAVIFCMEDNSYGFPHEETLRRLHERRVMVYRTDLNGTVVVHSDGMDYYVETGRGEGQPGSGPLPHPHPTIDINRAGLQELTRIIHVGPARAQQIIEGRPFGSLDELSRIPGIDANRVEDIRQQNLAFVTNPTNP